MTIKKTTVTFLLVLVLALCPSANSLATTTGEYLTEGTTSFANGDYKYTVSAWLYYNSNTSAAIDIYCMSMTVKNRGIYPVNEISAEAFDANYNKHTVTSGSITPISGGTTKRCEFDWEAVCQVRGYNSVYQKNSSQHYAYTDTCAGYGYAYLAGISCIWRQTSKSASFHH